VEEEIEQNKKCIKKKRYTQLCIFGYKSRLNDFTALPPTYHQKNKTGYVSWEEGVLQYKHIY
jgi:hypothetical protein